MRLDAISMLRAIYRTAPDERAWLAGIVEATATRQHGVFGYTYVTHPRRGVELTSMADAGPVFPRWWTVLEPLLKTPSSRMIDAYFREYRPFRWALRGTTGGLRAWVSQIVDATECADVLLATRTDPSGAGIAVGFPFLPGQPLKVPPRTLHRLACVASHLNAARRLRQALGRSWHEAPVEGILAADGQVLHLEGPLKEQAKNALVRASATRNRVRARKLPTDEAMRAWRALVAGRWSLVDHIESDGRRLVLARRNDPRVREPRGLNGRERTIAALAATGRNNKAIAYELGLSPTTIATHLTSAITKLGLSSRADLVRAFGPSVE